MSDDRHWCAIPRAVYPDDSPPTPMEVVSQFLVNFNPHHDKMGKFAKGGAEPEGTSPSKVGRSDLTHDESGKEVATTTEKLMAVAATRVAARWTVSDGDLKTLLKEEGVGKDFAKYSGTTLKEHAAEYFIRQWASSSGSPVAVAAVSHVADSLGLSYKLLKHHSEGNDYIRSNPELNRATSSLGAAIYHTTQDWLVSKGIKHLEVHRVGGLSEDRLFSSWSTTFGGARAEGGAGDRVKVSVPARYVFSVAGTGFGTLHETEAVLLPRPPGVTVTLNAAPLGGLVLGFNPAHDKQGKFAKGSGSAAGTGKKPRALNRPTEPHERVPGAAPKAKKWVDPPPKTGKKGLVKAGGKIERGRGTESQTALGNLTEAVAKSLGFRNILPKGKRSFTAEEVKEKGSSIDVEYDHSGRLYELKMCNTTSTEYRLKAKKEEKDDKERYARGVQAEAWTLVGVRDKDAKTIHFYAAKKRGLTGAEVSNKNFDFIGKVSYK